MDEKIKRILERTLEVLRDDAVDTTTSEGLKYILVKYAGKRESLEYKKERLFYEIQGILKTNN